MPFCPACYHVILPCLFILPFWARGTITKCRILKKKSLAFFLWNYCMTSRRMIIFSKPQAYPQKVVNANPVLVYGRNKKNARYFVIVPWAPFCPDCLSYLFVLSFCSAFLSCLFILPFWFSYLTCRDVLPIWPACLSCLFVLPICPAYLTCLFDLLVCPVCKVHVSKMCLRYWILSSMLYYQLKI